MSDYSFLPHFITEEIYLVKEEVNIQAPEPVAEEPEAPSPKQVESSPVEPQIAEEPETVYLKALPTEGNNLKHCLVLVESTENVLEAELKGLLEKIMQAVKRSMDDILLVNVKEAGTEQLEALLSEHNHRHLLAFGTQKLDQLTEVAKYEIVEVQKKYYLKADSLKVISENVALKKALWKALQSMFS